MRTPDDAHYEMVARNAGNLVIFVGAGANAAEPGDGWQEGVGVLPDDRDIARHLSTKAQLLDPPPQLAGVAQLAIARYGEPQVFGWIRQILLLAEDPVPNRVHELLAGLPAKLEATEQEAQYQLIVTSSYDAALECAFGVANEEFDVAVYKMSPSGPGQPRRFVHLPSRGMPTDIGLGASDYTKFPIVRDPGTSLQRLLRTVIVRINGVVDDPAAHYEDWPDNFVLTEDDYIGYLSGVPVEQVVPMQIRAKLMQAHYLFLGYTLADWRLRVFLQRIWNGPRLGSAKRWAVATDPSDLDDQLWQGAGVDLYRSGLVDYLQGLFAFLDSRAG